MDYRENQPPKGLDNFLLNSTHFINQGPKIMQIMTLDNSNTSRIQFLKKYDSKFWKPFFSSINISLWCILVQVSDFFERTS